MDTNHLGVLVRARRAGPRVVQLVYEKGVRTRNYHTNLQTDIAMESWKRLASDGTVARERR